MKWNLRIWEMKNGEESSYFDRCKDENDVRTCLSCLKLSPSVTEVWIMAEDASAEFLTSEEWLERYPEPRKEDPKPQKEDYSGSRKDADAVVVTRTWLTDEELEKTPEAVNGCRYDLEVYVRGVGQMPGYYMTLASYYYSSEACKARRALMDAAQILPEREDPKPRVETLEREWGWNPMTGERTPLFIGEFKGLRKETR